MKHQGLPALTLLLSLLAMPDAARAEYVKTQLASFNTTSTTFVDVTGGQLVFVPDSASDVWVVLVSAKLKSTAFNTLTVEARYLVNGVEHGIGGIENDAATGASWLHFYRVTGTTATQTVQVQLRDQQGPGATATIEDLQLIAFRLPAGADFQYAETEATQAVGSVWTTYQSLNFTPSRDGDYLILGLANGSEAPSLDGIGVRLVDPAAGLWPDDTDPGTQDGHFDSDRSPWYSMFLARVQTLDATPKTYAIQANGASGGATIRYTRLMAFRTDAFADFATVEDLAETSTSSTAKVVKSALTTAGTPAPREHVVLQSLVLYGDSNPTEARQAAFEQDNVPQTTYSHVLAADYTRVSYGHFDALTTTASVDYENSYSTSNAAYTVDVKESVIHVLTLGPASTSCSLLGASEGPGTITVTGSGSFEMSFDTAAGGSIREFHDLAEDPTGLYDLAGGTNGGLLSDSFEAGGTWYDSSYNDVGAKLDLLEVTSTRVRVRAEAFYQESGVIAPGLKAHADYTIHPSGRLALRWERRATATVNYDKQEIDQVVHLEGLPPLDNWTAYSQSGLMPGLGSDDFTLIKGDTTGLRTDFLRILYTDWGAADFTNWLASGPAEYGFTTWREDNPGSLSPATSQRFDFAVYFKPTSLVDHTDPAVTDRSADYRVPAIPGRTVGESWRDPEESTGSDDFNEAEAAYLFGLDPTLGLRFDLDGATTTRFRPFFKIRQWRSLSPPWTITFDPDSGGPSPPVTLTRDADYISDVKPVSRAPFADDLLWHSTLQDAAAVTNPDVGTGGTVGGTATSEPGRYGNGYLFDANDEVITVNVAGDLDYSRGAAELWYQPRYDHDDGNHHRLWAYRVDDDHQLIVRKLNLAGNDELVFQIRSVAWTTTTVASTDYSWRAWDWVHVRVTWDELAAPGEQARIFLNGVEPPHTDNMVDYNPVPAEWTAGILRIGTDSNGARSARGVIDEFRVYSSPTAPGPGGTNVNGRDGLAQGGLTTNTSEYLAEAGRDFTYALSPVDDLTTRRGEYAYFGSDTKFRGLNILLDTPGASGGTLDLQWEFWNGTSWTNLVVNDGTSALTRTGTVSWSDDPFSWSPYSVNGGPDLYYVRAHLADSSDPYSTPPVEALIKTDVLLFQYCGDVATDNEEFIFAAPVPTAVELLSFAAAPLDSAVDLFWRTGSELDNLGFHLYRSQKEVGPWTRVTPSLIPGLGSSPEGASYAFRDEGLVDGTRYYYRLEDIDTASVSAFHGPVSVVPLRTADGGGGAGGGGEGGAPSPGSEPSPEPSEPLPGEGEVETPGEGPVECPEEGACLYGAPGDPTLRVESRSAEELTVELETPGFQGAPDPVGMQVSLRGFSSPTRPHAVDLPFKRAVLDAVVGRRARLVSIEAVSETSWSGLAPAVLGPPAVDSRPDGTARPVRRRVPLGPSSQGAPRARLAGSGFMGQTKKLTLELYPLRWDPGLSRLVLTQTLRVRIAFTGSASGESGNGSLGRRRPRRRRSAAPVYAFLHTTHRGLHAVSYEAVFSGPRRALPLSALRLVQGDRVVPIHVEPAGRVFGPGSVLYFYVDRGPASTDFSSELSFALERAGGGTEMSASSAPPVGGSVAFPSYGLSRFETNRIYQSGLLDAPDPWLWQYAQSGSTEQVRLALEGVHTASALAARVRVFLQGGSDAGVAGEHHVTFSLNGVSLAGTRFEGKVPHLFEGALPASALREGPNTLTFTNVGDTGVVSRVFVDRVEVEYPQDPALRGGRFGGEWTEGGVAEVTVEGTALDPPPVDPSPLVGTPGEGSTVTLTGQPRYGDGGFLVAPPGNRPLGTTGLCALDVTDPGAPVWLRGLASGPGSVRMQVEAGRHYAVVAPEGLLVPRVSFPADTGLRDTQNQADYIVVSPEAFQDAAQPLLGRRESQGLTTFVAYLEDIATEFGGGSPSAEAIREFLAFAYHSWQEPSPRYVLLLGDASFDPRNFTGADQGAPLPALWAKTSYLWTASDPALAAVNGEDLLPDVALGRLPATDLAQAHALVQKILDWEEGGYDLSGPATLVADNPDLAGDFEADIADISASFLAQRDPQKHLVRILGAATRSEILDDLDGGLSLLSYVGHGGSAVWASENVLNSFDPAKLLAQPRQPLMLTMNCLNGYFVQPHLDSLAEAFLKAEGRGTIAAFSPSGLSVDGPAHVFHRALMDEIVNGNHERLGDAILAAQQAYAVSGHMPELLAIYHLLGDPGMRIR